MKIIMINSLYNRLALVMLGLFLAAALLLSGFFYHVMDLTQHETSQKLHYGVADYIVQHSGAIRNGEFDQENIKKAFGHLMLLGPATELYVLDKQGHVQAYDAPDEKIIHHHVALEPIKRFLADNVELPILGDDPRSDKQKVFSAAPIYDGEKQLKGYLYIILTGEIYDTISADLRTSQTLKLSFLGLILGLVFLLLAALVLFYTMTRPLKKLSLALQQFEQSDFTKQPNDFSSTALSTTSSQASIITKPIEPMVNAHTCNEMQQLQQSFHRMSHTIVQQFNYLKKHDKIRREFLAYVSHDLRTPLAGTQAYLETLKLKDEALSAEQRRDFIHKAIVNTERLAKMIDELFELARLDNAQVNNGLMLQAERFPIMDVLSDLYAVTIPKAQAKNITLAMDCTENDIMVYADLSRISRVLQNLTENALHYTPEGGEVRVSTQITQDSVVFMIKDSGKGISEEDLPWIFQPYYRSQTAKMQHKKGVGLGLAISQKIIALHHSELLVQSKLGKGTCFSFRLGQFAPSLP